MTLTRSPFFHPVIFYPLLLLAAAALIYLSLRPDLLPGAPQAQAGRTDAAGAIVLEGAALSHPEAGAEQNFHIQRDGLGRAQSLHIAVLPNQPPPTPADQGVRVLIAPAAAEALSGRPVRVEVTVRPLPITTASGLAVSWQGIGPTEWVTRTLQPQAQIVAFDLPPQTSPEAVGLRVIASNNDYRYGFDIARIRVVPRTPPPTP